MLRLDHWKKLQSDLMEFEVVTIVDGSPLLQKQIGKSRRFLSVKGNEITFEVQGGELSYLNRQTFDNMTTDIDSISLFRNGELSIKYRKGTEAIK